MRFTRVSTLFAAATLAALAPVAAPAAPAPVDTAYGNPQPQEERGFPWGLLGLLGLLGLMPRKRTDRIDVDNRTPR